MQKQFIPVLGHIILISSAPSVGRFIVDVHHVNVFVWRGS